MDKKELYIPPVISVKEIVAMTICQSIQQYKLEGDSFDDDSD